VHRTSNDVNSRRHSRFWLQALPTGDLCDYHKTPRNCTDYRTLSQFARSAQEVDCLLRLTHVSEYGEARIISESVEYWRVRERTGRCHCAKQACGAYHTAEVSRAHGPLFTPAGGGRWPQGKTLLLSCCRATEWTGFVGVFWEYQKRSSRAGSFCSCES